MKLPNQSQPVIKSNTTTYNGEVNASGVACTICMAGCAVLPFPANLACEAACRATVC